MCDEYNGWVNRETWAAALYLSNDQGLYALVNEYAEQCGDDVIRLEDIIRTMFEEWEADVIEGASDSRELRMMLLDIGSLYRVDCGAIARNWLGG